VFSCDFSLFPNNEKLLSQIKVNNFDLKAYYLSLGATTNDVVQVRKSDSTGNEIILKVFENYNSAELIKVDSNKVFVVLEDRFKGAKNPPDTVKLEIDAVY